MFITPRNQAAIQVEIRMMSGESVHPLLELLMDRLPASLRKCKT
jgi:hypothetical protein